jgi:hypothetical protein
VGVFIHWQASDDKKIYRLQLQGSERVDLPRAARASPRSTTCSRSTRRPSPVRRRRRRLSATLRRSLRRGAAQSLGTPPGLLATHD